MSASAPPELSYAQPLFLEEQRASAVLGNFSFAMWSIAGGVILAVAIAFIVAHNRLPSALMGVLLIASVLVAGVVSVMTMLIGITVVEPADLQIRLTLLGFTVWKRTIPLAKIQSAELSTPGGGPMILQWMQGDLGFMTRKQCVRLRLAKFQNILIGTERPDELLAAIKGVLPDRPAA
jgi:hypothetical protein